MTNDRIRNLKNLYLNILTILALLIVIVICGWIENNNGSLASLAVNSSFVFRNNFVDSQTFSFYNVLTPKGADPWVYKHTDGYYYMTYTNGQDITLLRSVTLSGIGGGERKTIWTPPNSGSNSKNIWAPELHFLGKNWYVYYAADNGNNTNHRMFVLENTNPDPFQGAFVDKGKIFDKENDKWAIDGTVLSVNREMYFIWSGWESDNNIQQNLYIAPMSNPTMLSGSRVKISIPTFAWETVGNPPTVNEGPQIIIKDQTINLVYSASGSWTDNYCLGLLTAKIGSDLLSPDSWYKHNKPVFQSKNGVFGPGHCSFVKSPTKAEDWIVYHAANYSGSGWNRHIRTQRFEWNRDGTPKFGFPAVVDLPIALPDGEPQHYRYQAENGIFDGVAKIVPNPDASNGAKVGYIDTPESYVEFSVQIKNPGLYNMSVRFSNGTDDKKEASHKLFINGKEMQAIRYEWTGWENWLNTVIRVQLNAGMNKIRFSKGENFTEIDCIDIFPLH
jgi:GH43 family beta-xylosidase